MRVLLIEEDALTAQSIELMLKSESFNVYTMNRGQEALDRATLYEYDMILLDMHLSNVSGYEILQMLRATKVHTPVIILSGLAGVEDKVRGFSLGADDYITKPFHKDELIARMYAIMRRTRGHALSVITTGELSVDIELKTVTVCGEQIYFTNKEYQIVEILSLHKGQTVSGEVMMYTLYGDIDPPLDKIINVYISKIRKKIKDAGATKKYIFTVHGRGYMLSEDEL